MSNQDDHMTIVLGTLQPPAVILKRKACQLTFAVMWTGQLVREVSISSLQPQSVVSAMQLVGPRQHRSQLAIAVSGSELISWVHISDAAAIEAVLASRFDAMHVEQAGKCNDPSRWHTLDVPLITCSDCQWCRGYSCRLLYLHPPGPKSRAHMSDACRVCR